jgi:hypothetical protein
MDLTELASKFAALDNLMQRQQKGSLNESHETPHDRNEFYADESSSMNGYNGMGDEYNQPYGNDGWGFDRSNYHQQAACYSSVPFVYAPHYPSHYPPHYPTQYPSPYPTTATHNPYPKKVLGNDKAYEYGGCVYYTHNNQSTLTSINAEKKKADSDNGDDDDFDDDPNGGGGWESFTLGPFENRSDW